MFTLKHLKTLRTAVRHISPNTAHVHTPYVMLPHHHTNFLHF